MAEKLDLMTVDEVAKYLKVTTKTIYRLLKKGMIPTCKVGHLWRFDRAEINIWLKDGGNLNYY